MGRHPNVQRPGSRNGGVVRREGPPVGIDQTVARTVPGHLGFIVGPAGTATGYRVDVDDFTLTDLA